MSCFICFCASQGFVWRFSETRVFLGEKKPSRESGNCEVSQWTDLHRHAPCDPCLASWEYPSISHQTGRKNHLTSYLEGEYVSSLESSHLHESKFHRTKRELLAASKTTSKKPLPLISKKSGDIVSPLTKNMC